MKRRIGLLLFLYVTAGLVWNAPASIQLEIESLINQLNDEEQEVYDNASLNLVRIGKPAVPELVRVLPLANRPLSVRIVEVFSRMGCDAQDAVPALIAALRRPNITYIVYPSGGMHLNYHSNVSLALAKIGSAAVPELIEALSDVNKNTRYYAASTLEALASEAQASVPALISVLDDENDKVREAAASALGTMGDDPFKYDSFKIRQDTYRLMFEDDPESAVWQGDHPAQAAVPSLIQMLEDENDYVRIAAASTLGKIGDATAVPALMATLKHRTRRVSNAASKALGQIGAPAKAAVPVLIRMLELETPTYLIDDRRIAIIEGLGGIGTPAVVPVLIEALNDEWDLIRRAAVIQLRRIDKPVDEIVPLLLKMLADSDPGVRLESSKGLYKIGEPAIPCLIEALSHESPVVGKWAAYALAAMGSVAQPAVPALKQALRVALKDKDTSVSLGVFQALTTALREIGTPEALEAIEEFEKSHKIEYPFFKPINVRSPHRPAANGKQR